MERVELRCWGGVGEVTGSCYEVSLGKERVLLDCGLLQGGAKEDARNYDTSPYDARRIDAVVLSHSHLDHSGRLPRLQKEGFRGPIYTHRASRDLCSIMLRDSAHLQEADAEIENRKRARKGLKPIEPLYTQVDVERIMRKEDRCQQRDQKDERQDDEADHGPAVACETAPEAVRSGGRDDGGGGHCSSIRGSSRV